MSEKKHCLKHKRGAIRNISEGENWLNMMYGIFHEPQEEICATNGHTGVCFEMNGEYLAVKNYSNVNAVLICGAGETDFVEQPRLKMRILQQGDCIQIMYPNDIMIEEEIVLEYRKE